MNIIVNIRHLVRFFRIDNKHVNLLVLSGAFTFFALPQYLNGQVTAGFSCIDSSGCNNLIVTFINQSQGSNLSYSWSFGNGTSSTEPNPQVVFTAVGSYTIKLFVTNGTVTDSLIKPNYINVYKSPKALFESNSTKIGCSPLSVTFHNKSIPGDAPISVAIWDFGDGSSGNQSNAVHTYTKLGIYDVSLYVRDTNTCESNYSIENFVHVTSKPVVQFSSSTPISCLDTLSINFINNSSGETGLIFLWNFGDNTTSNLQNPNHFYSSFNQYNVKLKATDDYGCSDSLIKTNYVELQELQAGLTFGNDTICSKQNLEITNTTTGASDYHWDFGDGTTSNQLIPQKSYSDTGAFEIQYIAIFKNTCYDTLKFPIYVDPLVAAFESDTHYICQLPKVVNYKSLSDNAYKWEWHFGYGNISYDEAPHLNFALNQQIVKNPVVYYSDSLIVESKFGCRDTAVIPQNIYLNLPSISITPNDSNIYLDFLQGCIPLKVDFNDRSKSNNEDDPLVSRKWSFGDNTTSTIKDPSHTYSQAGTYKAELQITNQTGCVNTTDVTIRTGSPQNAKFSYEGNDTICGSKLIEFVDQSSDMALINGWLWDISDGNKYQIPDPTIQIFDTGYISVSLIVLYNGCPSNTYDLENLVYVSGPAGSFLPTMNCNDPYHYSFTSFVRGTDKWYWYFGDGDIDSSQSVTVAHDYTQSQDYKVTLASTNSKTGCNLIKEQIVYPRKIKADFVSSSEIGCINTPIEFDPEASEDEVHFASADSVATYLWEFDDTPVKFTSFGTMKHSFKSSGDHRIKLTVFDFNHCSNQVEKTLHINNIRADFAMDQSGGCSPMKVSFTDLSTADTVLVGWNWNFGTGTVSDIQNPACLFDGQGNFDIRLIVTDAKGCSDTVIKDKVLTVLKPFVNFSAKSVNNCNGDSVYFINDPLASIRSFNWDFGDGSHSNIQNPAHVFPDTGYYSISLSVVDSLGCDSIISKEKYVFVQSLPVADFGSNNTYSICYPSIIGFEDKSESDDLQTWIWDFGDGERLEQVPFPFHTYKKPGKYDISLIVKTSIGCADTLIKAGLINIGGPLADIIAPDSFCVNIPASVSFANPVNIYSFQWIDDAGETFTTNSFTKTYETQGIKRIYLSLKSDDLGSCDKLLTDSIIIPELKADFFVTDVAGCVPLFIGVSSTTLGSQDLEWFKNDDLLGFQDKFSIQFTNSGSFDIKLLAKNEVGCKDSSDRTITVFPLPDIQITEDTLICQFDTIQLSASGGIIYHWNSSVSITDPEYANILIMPQSSAKYIVTVTDTNTCINYDSVTITVQPKPLAQIMNDDTIRLIIGEEINLESHQQYGDHIYWSPVDYLACPGCGSTTAVPLNSLTYYFNVQDENHCFVIKDSVYVFVDAIYSVDLPNSFTPNNDKINDVIYVKGWGIKELKSFKVFNQQGRLLFESNDIDQGWDGNSKYGKQPPGLYLYKVEVISYDNQIRTKEGFFYIF